MRRLLFLFILYEKKYCLLTSVGSAFNIAPCFPVICVRNIAYGIEFFLTGKLYSQSVSSGF